MGWMFGGFEYGNTLGDEFLNLKKRMMDVQFSLQVQRALLEVI